MKKGEYYRVKTGKHLGGNWTVAEYLGNDEWYLCGNECEIGNKELVKVGTAIRLPKK
jgi:hypothetical protein